MKQKFTLTLAAALLSGFFASAQTWVADSITMGPNYGNDVYYSLKNGAQGTSPNNSWHLAFQMTPPGPYGNVSILANHAGGNVKVFSLHKQASTSFATLSAADTTGLTSDAQQLYNSDSSWNFGAFNRMADPSNPFDYSWGSYDQNTHFVTGDSLYLIKVGNTPYKIWIQQYVSLPQDSVHWTFRIAQFDGTGDTVMKIYQPPYADRLFGYYNVTTMQTTNREPARSNWDFVFTRYTDLQSLGPISVMYPVTGVLSNFGVSAADVRSSDPDGAVLQNYTLVDPINTIGSDWKIYDMSNNVYNLDTVSYFIKTENTNEYYQLQFTRFDGSSTGKTVFRKKLIGDVAMAVNNITNDAVNNFYMGPNPAVNNTQLMIDAKKAAGDAQVIVTDINGRLIQRLPISIRQGMNGYNFNTTGLTSGMYLVTITDGSSWKLSSKLIVQH